MKIERLRDSLDRWFPHIGSQPLEGVRLMAPDDFRTSFASSAKDITGTLRFADFRNASDSDESVADLRALIDDASFHGTLALVFIRQLLELGKERVPVQPSRFGSLTSSCFKICDASEERADGFDLIRRCAETIAQHFQRLKVALEGVESWEDFTRWAVEFTAHTGSLIALAADVCAADWTVL